MGWGARRRARRIDEARTPGRTTPAPRRAPADRPGERRRRAPAPPERTPPVITAHGVELRVGARVLLHEATFQNASGDRIGLVGRNGARKTTLTTTLAGETQPTAGRITRGNEIGYLPQDPRTGDLDVIAMDRVLSARSLDKIVRQMRETEGAMASADPETHEAAMERYPRLEARF